MRVGLAYVSVPLDFRPLHSGSNYRSNAQPKRRQYDLTRHPPLRHPELRLAGLHLLVVDDIRINRFIVQRMLSKEGAMVSEAADGQQALDYLRTTGTERVDAVLMDIQMPVMDGLTATRAIREELRLTDLPVIALTAGVLPEERQAALESGINDLLPKPLDLDRMTAMIRHYCPVRIADSAT